MSNILRMFPGNRIRQLRIAADLNQGELGSRVGLSQGQISNIENGERTLSLDWMRRIARALGVSVADLLDDKDNPQRLSDEEKRLVENFRAGAKPQQAVLLHASEALKGGDVHDGKDAA